VPGRVRKWDDPSTGSPLAPATQIELRGGARAFRRWLARGAQPGVLRALADDQPCGAQPTDELLPVLALVGGAARADVTRPRRAP
jgi:hypothetical protein